MTSHYRTLGVDPEADTVVIRSAYLALMRRYHPDRGGEEADPERAQQVTAAWEVLRDAKRRAAYDETRRAQFLPGGVALADSRRVRGGATGRNLFLLLAAATVGLGWWALQQPELDRPVQVTTAVKRPAAPRPSELEIRPEDDRQAMHRRIEVAGQPASPEPRPEPDAEPKVTVPLSPATVHAKIVRIAAKPQANSERSQTTVHPPARREVRTASATPVAAAPPIDLAPLERHLALLTDQSLRFGTEAKRTRLLATRETFNTQLRGCEDDACKRNAYLRRNAEIGEIMRNQ